MKNTLVHDEHYGTFLRLNKTMARKVFETGATIAVMTSDRNPVNSLTSETYYKKGSKANWYYDSENGEGMTILSFDHLLKDFGEFLCCDGYGHMPDPVRGMNHQFSYWVKLNNDTIHF